MRAYPVFSIRSEVRDPAYRTTTDALR